jgi:RNase H-fold protein (predicted Holliday junction resolvase)
MAKQLGLTDVSHAALIRAAREVVAGALAGDFPQDPVIGPDLSRAISTLGSVVKRHGGLIELGIAGALIASERFVVLTNVALPVTKGAAQLLDAKNSDQALAKIRLSADSEADGIVNVDLVVVDPEAKWAGAYEIKRGNGATEHGKRRQSIHKLRAARLVLESYLRQAGYGTMETCTSGVIDYYGSAGFTPEFTLLRDELDDHFGVPVVATVDAMTAALQEELKAALPRLFGPFLASLPAPDGGERKPTGNAIRVTAEMTERAAMDPAVVHALTAPLTGPGHGTNRRKRSQTPTFGESPQSAH